MPNVFGELRWHKHLCWFPLSLQQPMIPGDKAQVFVVGQKLPQVLFAVWAASMSAVLTSTMDDVVVTIPTVNSRALIKRLERDGWTLVRVKGSHHQFKHPRKPGLVTVKHPASEIPTGTLRSIEKQAGWR